MKLSPHRFARAIAQLSITLPADQQAGLADAVVAELEARGQRALLRTLPRLVEEALEEARGIVPASLTVATPATHEQKDLALALERALSKKVDFTVETDPALLGGARLQIKDDRFDYSLRSALTQAQRLITALM